MNDCEKCRDFGWCSGEELDSEACPVRSGPGLSVSIELTSDIRWTDKVSVTSNGDIIDFNGRILGHINMNSVKSGADMRKKEV